MTNPLDPGELVWRLMPDGLVWVRLESMTVVDANPVALQLWQLEAPPRGIPLFDLMSPASEVAFKEIVQTCPLSWERRDHEVRLKNSRRHFARWLARSDGAGQSMALLMIGAVPTMTSRDQDRLAWTLDALHQSFIRLLPATSEMELLAAACDGVTASGRYALAWIGLAADDREQRVVVVSSGGEARRYLDGLELSWSDSADLPGMAGQAIRSGRAQVKNRLHTFLDVDPLAVRAAQFDIQAVMSLPLVMHGRTIGAFTIYSTDAEAFGPEQVALFEQLAANVVMTLREYRVRQAYRDEAVQRGVSSQRLERVLEQTIETLSGALGERDPYTVGHQRGVADMAVGIARRMGLSEERCHVLHLAGIVHDIGKIRVPLELLTKPTPLRPQELAVIKQHAQATIDILSGIDWPWPLAQMAGQHHERMDGSGYPAGLKGDEIMLESRILAVADILESMSSPRPYRPAIGLDAALDVIKSERGTRLDADVVDAALAVFGESPPLVSGQEHG